MYCKFIVWCPEDGETEEDGRPIKAFDSSLAAQEWAKIDDSHSADYRIVGGTDVTVTVKDVASDRIVNFLVSGETVAIYHASVIRAQEET